MPNERVVERPYGAPSRAETRLRGPAPVFLGHSVAARRVRGQIAAAIAQPGPVLVSGKPGTGKRLIAAILHHFGDHDAPELDIIDLGRRVERLGDFTFVAPIERLSLPEQARLPGLAHVSGLVIATLLPLDEDESHARIDPKLRAFCSHHIELPTLAEHIEDLETIALAILARTPMRRHVGGISEAALDCMRRHDWPGNVRELEQVIATALVAGAERQIEIEDLPPYLRRHAETATDKGPEQRLCLEVAEREAIKRALEYAHGNKRKAARLLHIGKTTLYRKIRAYEIE